MAGFALSVSKDTGGTIPQLQGKVTGLTDAEWGTARNMALDILGGCWQGNAHDKSPHRQVSFTADTLGNVAPADAVRAYFNGLIQAGIPIDNLGQTRHAVNGAIEEYTLLQRRQTRLG